MKPENNELENRKEKLKLVNIYESKLFADWWNTYFKRHITT